MADGFVRAAAFGAPQPSAVTLWSIARANRVGCSSGSNVLARLTEITDVHRCPDQAVALGVEVVVRLC